MWVAAAVFTATIDQPKNLNGCGKHPKDNLSVASQKIIQVLSGPAHTPKGCYIMIRLLNTGAAYRTIRPIQIVYPSTISMPYVRIVNKISGSLRKGAGSAGWTQAVNI